MNNKRDLRIGVALTTIAIATVLLVAQLATPELGVGRAIADALSAINRTLSAKATVGSYEFPLKDGESYEVLDSSTVDALLAERAAAAPSLDDLLENPGKCIRVRPKDGSETLLFVCAPAALNASGIDPSATMPPEQGVVYIELLRAQQLRLTVDPQIQASWINESEELMEHRTLLLADGYAVGTGIISATFNEHTPMGMILEWSGGAEWIGYLWIRGDTYLTWAWAPSRAALDSFLTR